jgi:hypothetical protein
MPASGLKTSERITLVDRLGNALPDVQIEVKDAQGKTELAGGSDASGSTPTLTSRALEKIKLTLE